MLIFIQQTKKGELEMSKFSVLERKVSSLLIICANINDNLREIKETIQSENAQKEPTLKDRVGIDYSPILTDKI